MNFLDSNRLSFKILLLRKICLLILFSKVVCDPIFSQIFTILTNYLLKMYFSHCLPFTVILVVTGDMYVEAYEMFSNHGFYNMRCFVKFVTTVCFFFFIFTKAEMAEA